MSPQRRRKSKQVTAKARAGAFGIHIFTALGAAIALLALLEAVREHWSLMFGWLGVALLIDAIDGPMARKFDVKGALPNWSGDTLDLVVDFVTYVFVPAYAITASGLLIPLATPMLGVAIVVSGALYFADKRMKGEDNHFRGFPALWNAAAFYLFLLKPPAAVGSLLLAILVVLTFVPFNVMHPLRTIRFRTFNLALIAVWALLAIFILWSNFEVSFWVTVAFCIVGGYVMLSDKLIQIAGLSRA
ncbi:MAG: phosphatidylcholine synthase [Rhizobiales bacterium]|nr:phosphatidylcholine synthase [Hyphomicrobiales bacterium]